MRDEKPNVDDLAHVAPLGDGSLCSTALLIGIAVVRFARKQLERARSWASRE